MKKQVPRIAQALLEQYKPTGNHPENTSTEYFLTEIYTAQRNTHNCVIIFHTNGYAQKIEAAEIRNSSIGDQRFKYSALKLNAKSQQRLQMRSKRISIRDAVHKSIARTTNLGI